MPRRSPGVPHVPLGAPFVSASGELTNFTTRLKLRIISESEVRWDKPDVSSGATHSSADLNGDGIPELAA